MVHLEQVRKLYRTPAGTVEALRGVDLEIPSGQFVAIQGPNGCGKSTLLNLIGGLAAPTTGRVVVHGHELSQMSPGARARFRAERIGFVFQTFHLLPYLTVWDNVAMAAPPSQSATARLRAKEILERFHLDHRLRHRPAELSVGECQRVAMARALLNQPLLLLADEPTGNLDPDNTLAAVDMFRAYHQEGGTVILVTHQQRVAEYSQRVVRMEAGTIVSG